MVGLGIMDGLVDQFNAKDLEMKFSTLLTHTMRNNPSEADTPSHKYMLRAGMVMQIASGIYTYLPLAWRSIKKIETIIREEIEMAGGQEVRMPVLQPVELWEETGRQQAFGDTLFTLKDRRGRGMVLAPTHEEVLSHIGKTYVQSYRDMPLIIYQIQTKFRDEPRPRAGLIRVREFDMKDAYSLDVNEKCLDLNYQRMALAYRNIYRRCGLPAIMVEADSGAIGGKDSHEFILPAATGEDTIITCSNCEYAANLEKAVCNYPTLSPSELLLLEEIHTPGVTTISGLEKVLKIDRQQILKSIIYVADKEIVGTVIRGDLEVNEVKLKNVLKAKELRLADSKEIISAGLVPGFISPVGMTEIRWIGDNSIKLRRNYVAGGNKADIHFKNINWSRDFAVDELVDMAEVTEKGLCVNCNSPLQSLKGIEVGHIFKLGTFFSERLGVNFLDQDGKNQPVIMGCYGIGIGRLLAAAIEQNHDENGIVFPVPIAPYSVHLVGLNLHDENVINSSNSLYSSLWQEGIDCLFDDRIDESAGVKFNDADLMGFPIRVIVSRRGVEKSSCEIKVRSGSASNTVPLTEATAFIKQMLATIKSD